MHRRAAVLSVLALAVLLAACNGDDSPVVDAGDDPTTTSSTSGTSSTLGAPAMPTTPLPVSAPVPPTRGYLADVRVAGHGSYDRVVFAFEDALPGYQVSVTKRPVVEDGSGREVQVEGGYLLQVRFENAATARLDGERVVEVYKGSDRVKGDTKAVVEVVDTGDFEGYVTWVIGVQAEAAVNVTTQTAPDRLVVDVQAA